LNYWAVRGTTVAIALVWIVVLGLVGVLCLGGPERHEPQQNESRIAFWSLVLVLGYSILQAVFNAQEWLPTINKLPITVILLAIVPIASFVWRTRHRELDSQTIVDSKNASGSQPADQSLDKPWKRRLYGLATISCVLLAIIHIVGAMVPSVDVQVRNQKWVSTADAYEQQSASNMMLHSEGGDTKKATCCCVSIYGDIAG
jgi:Ca2+/H+ antiporter